MGACASNGAIKDYANYEDFLKDLKACGVLEDCEISIAIDATGSNNVTGKASFGGRCLHDLSGPRTNPYIETMQAAVKFFERDVDGSIPLYFFGSVEAAQVGGAMLVKECSGLEDLVATYKEEIPKQNLSGPTEIVSVLSHTMERVRESGRFHLLLILTDGAITEENRSKPRWPQHHEALNAASKLPMAVVSVGLGDGPFDAMTEFDDEVPSGRVFDNFQFMPFKGFISKEEQGAIEKEFFFQAFAEVPTQYRLVKERLGYKRS